MTDNFNLQRFTEAQDLCYESVTQELRAGDKRGHWMWYIFPQVKGLGLSGTSQMYSISSQDEAKAYWDNPILGSRLKECTQLVINVMGRTATQIFSYPDNMKFCSCMTLFERSANETDIFQTALQKYFNGEPDHLTLDILKREGN